MSGQAGRYQRSAAGMIGAMVVLVIMVVGFVVLRDLNRSKPEPRAGTVDYRQAASYAASQADFEILVPDALPQGWRATSAGFTPEPPSWHLRVLTDEGRYVGLEQAISPVETMLETYVDPEPTREPSLMIRGQRWQSWSDPGGDLAFTRNAGDLTTLVVGTAEREVLVDYIASLR